MKFLGEFIQHFVSRFRNDIFLEDVSSGTIASGGYLGVDSNNKIVKASTVGSSVDLTSEVTGILPVSNGGTGASTLASDSVLTGNGTSAIQAETHLTWSASQYLLSVEGEGASKPILRIQNNHSGSTSGELKFRKLSSVSDGDDLGKISFVGFAPSGSPTDVEFATILGEVNEADDGDEEGKLTLSVASHDGESQPGVTIVSGNAEDEVDVTIANGATSLTTIAGSLAVTSDLTVSGTTTTIDTTNLNVEDKNITLNYNASSDTSSSADGAGITIQDAVDASTDATILWTAASDTFTFSHPINATIATATQGTIDHDSLANFVAAEHYRWDTDISSTATIHTNNITDLHGAGVDGSANQLLTDDGDGTVTSETDLTFSSGALTMQSSAAQVFTLKRTSTGSDNDSIGTIRFTGNDDADNALRYAAIQGKIIDASNGAEEGQLNLIVASHDGEEVTGLSLTSGNAEDVIDVNIASGASSITSVDGELKVGGNITAEGSSANVLALKRASTGSDGDAIASIRFIGRDDADNTQTYGTISTEIVDASDGAEEGKLSLLVASHDGEMQSGLFMASGNAEDEVDVTIGNGAASLTTISGTLTMGSTATLNNSGVLQVAAQPNITSLGTLTTLTVDDVTINGSTITASADLNIVATGDDINIDTDNFTLESTGGNKPEINLRATGNHNKSPVLRFVKDKGAAGADDDAVGVISFKGDNDAQQETSMAGITVQVEDATDGSEEGKFTVSVKNTTSTGTTDSFTLTGNGTATDASIGSGSASVTTIAGTLTMGSTAFVNNSGVIQVATQGTIDHDSLANFVANEHIDWTGSSAGTIHSTNIPTLNQDTTGNAATATALTSGDKTIEGNLRIGGSGDTSNNWISIDAQNGNDTTGGGITFYETGTYSVSAPQYGAKIVYNEDDDEFAIGTMHNNTFQRQIHMDRGSTTVNMQNIHLERSTTDGPFFLMTKTDTSVEDGDSLCRIMVRSADFSTSTNISQIKWFATEDHDSNSCGNKMTFSVTPNGNSQSETTAMTIDQDSSVTVNGDLTVTSGTSGDATLIISADTDNNDENDNARLWFKQDGDITEGAIQMSSNALNIISNVSSSGGISFKTGTTDNTGTTDPSTGATERMSIASGGTVTVAGALQPNTIELGHASDTTLARSAAGTVTIEGNTIVTTAGSQTPMGSGTEDMPNVVFQLRKTLTTADMNSLHTTPVTLHSGAGTNRLVMPIGGVIRVDRAATNTNSPSLNIHYSGTTASYGTDVICHYRRFMNGVTTDAVFGIVPVGATSNRHLSDLTSDINNKVVISSSGAFTTDCFTSVDIFMTYQIIQIA